MTDLRLLRTQRNSILKIVERAGIDGRAFDLRESGGHFRLDYRGTDLFLDIGLGGDFSFDIHRCPGSGEWVSWNQTSAWHEVEEYVGYWSEGLREELAEPDLWAALFESPRFIDLLRHDDTDDKQLTVDERLLFSNKLGEIERYARDLLEGSESHLSSLSIQLADLRKTAETQGRRQVVCAAIGVIVTVGMSLVALAPDKARAFIDFAAGAIGEVFGGSLPALP